MHSTPPSVLYAEIGWTRTLLDLDSVGTTGSVGVAHAFDLAGITDTVGDRSFAFSTVHAKTVKV
jgi:hypothetical protein